MSTSIAGNTSTTAVLSADETEIHSIIGAGDADWFAVTLVAGMDYQFQVNSFANANPGLDGPDIALFGALGGSALTYSSNLNSATAAITYRATVSGTFYVEVRERNYDDIGQYALSWTATDKIRADVGTTKSLLANGSVSGNLETDSDADWFKLSMKSGLSYGLDLGAATTNQLIGGDLQLRDDQGNVVAYSITYGGTFNSIEFTPGDDLSGTRDYFLTVTESDSSQQNGDGSGDTGGYTVTWITTDTIQNNISTTNALARDTTVNSAIDVAGDTDWFKVTMNAGMTYGFQVLSRTTNPLQWGELELRDGQGNRIAYFNYGSTSTNTLAFTAATSGTYYVTVRDDDDDTGGYSLRNIGADSVRADVATAGRLVNGGAVDGEIEMLSDSDWYRIDTQQGVTYTFTLSGDGAAGELDNSTLILRDAAGNILVSDEFGALTSVTFTATTNGPLFVEAKGYDNTDWGSYVLTAVSNASTLTGTANADRLQGGAGATVINGNGGNDWLDGGIGNDRLFGSSDQDRLFGNANDDKLYGGTGDDTLNGGSGSDTLEGEAGNDVLVGGAASDRFVFRATSDSDTITDFQDGADRIQIIGGPVGFGGLTLATLGDDVRISFGTVRIVVEDITRADLTAADFIFG